jgi:allantoin racemase
MKKILDILPIMYSDSLEEGMKDRKKLAEEVSRWTGGNITLDPVCLEKGTASIEGFFDDALNTPYILQRVKKAEEEGYAAVVIDCFMDPGLEAARELVNIPVLGANESACHLAAQVAHKFSVINILPETENGIRLTMTKNGTINHLASLVTINIPVLDLEKKHKESVKKIVEASEKAVKEDGAYAIVFGCTGMSSLLEEVKENLTAKGINVPIIEPLRAAVFNAVMWIMLGISQSKEAYRPPRQKPRKIDVEI